MKHRFDDAERADARRLIRWGLEEDHARDDITSRLAVPASERARFVVRNRKPGVVAGIESIKLTLQELEADAQVVVATDDGVFCAEPTVLARVEGLRRDLLAAERTFLNLVGVLGGTASLTRRFVEAAGPTCAVMDTRKTWPGYRLLQKYAVRCGGGRNHRFHLADGVLLKDNHRHQGLGLPDLVAGARAKHRGVPVVIEVDDLEQLDLALPLQPDRVLLDNFDAAQVAEARRHRDRHGPGVGIEVSGGVDLLAVRALAEAGADCVSVGALTHSAPVWDVGLDRVEETE